MESIINNRMCRCCASEGTFKDVKTLYYWMGVEEVYADMLRECFDIDLTCVEAGEHGGICEVCITQLRNASNFKKQVLQTEDHFKKFLESSDKFFKTKIIKEEGVSKYDNLEDDDVGAPVLDSDNGSDDYPLADLEIKQEYKDELKTRKRTAKAGSSKAKKSKKDGESTSKRTRRTIKTESEDDMLIKIEVQSRSLKSKQGKVGVKIQTVNANNLESKLAIKWSNMKYDPNHADLHKNLENMKILYTYTNATPIRLYGGIGYKCAFCNNQYPNPEDLKTHTRVNHKDLSKAYFMSNMDKYKLNIKLDITGLQCSLCNETIDSLEQVIDHLTFQHKKTIHTDIKSYIIPFKFDTEMLQCCLCTNTYSKFKTLQEHMNNHYRNYICNVCDAGFINKLKLRHHEISHKVNEYKCEYCPKIFNTERKRKVHVQTVHLGENLKVKCGYCNEKFKDSRRKDKHVITAHGATPLTLKCQACEKIFSNQKSLSIHIKRDHLMERRHKCMQCDMRFFTTSELKLHMAKHTKVRQFMCQVCLKSYARHKTLKEHMRIHDDDRRFKCEYCGQAFVQKCSWKGHMRSKHGELV